MEKQSESYFNSVEQGLAMADACGELMRTIDKSASAAAREISSILASSQPLNGATGIELRDDYVPKRYHGRDRSELNRLLQKKAANIIFVGEVSSGKSTLWNTILGTNIFPKAIAACTKRITVVKYADVPYVKLMLQDVSHLSDGLKRKADEFQKQVSEGLKSSMSLPSELVAREKCIDPELAELLEKVDQVEVGLPAHLLKLGLIAVDSPGLNESETITKMTLNHMKCADNVVFLMNPQSGGFSEQNCQSLLMAINSSSNDRASPFDPLFVINKIDTLRAEYDPDDPPSAEEKREDDLKYKAELDEICQSAFDKIKHISHQGSNVLPSIIESDSYRDCRSFHAISAIRVLRNRTKLKKPEPPEWTRFSDSFNSFLQHSLFEPLLAAGLKVDEYGSAFVDQLLSEHNTEQCKMKMNLLQAKIPEAQEQVKRMVPQFMSKLAGMHKQLEAAIHLELSHVGEKYLDWAQEWRSPIEQERKASHAPEVLYQFGEDLLVRLQSRLVSYISQTDAVQMHLQRIETAFKDQTSNIIKFLKATASSAALELMPVVDLYEMSYLPEKAIPKRTFARRHRVKLMIGAGLPTLGVGSLAVWGWGIGKQPPWHAAGLSWPEAKRKAAEHFYKKLDASALANEYVERLKQNAKKCETLFDERVQLMLERVKEMAEVKKDAIPAAMTNTLQRVVSLAYLNNVTMATVKDQRLKVICRPTQPLESVGLPDGTDAIASEVKIEQEPGIRLTAVKILARWRPDSALASQIELERLLFNEFRTTKVLAFVPFKAPAESASAPLSIANLDCCDEPSSRFVPTALNAADVVMITLPGSPDSVGIRLSRHSQRCAQKSNSGTNIEEIKTMLQGISSQVNDVSQQVTSAKAAILDGINKSEKAVIKEIKDGNKDMKDQIATLCHSVLGPLSALTQAAAAAAAQPNSADSMLADALAAVKKGLVRAQEYANDMDPSARTTLIKTMVDELAELSPETTSNDQQAVTAALQMLSARVTEMNNRLVSVDTNLCAMRSRVRNDLTMLNGAMRTLMKGDHELRFRHFLLLPKAPKKAGHWLGQVTSGLRQQVRFMEPMILVPFYYDDHAKCFMPAPVKSDELGGQQGFVIKQPSAFVKAHAQLISLSLSILKVALKIGAATVGINLPVDSIGDFDGTHGFLFDEVLDKARMVSSVESFPASGIMTGMQHIPEDRWPQELYTALKGDSNSQIQMLTKDMYIALKASMDKLFGIGWERLLGLDRQVQQDDGTIVWVP